MKHALLYVFLFQHKVHVMRYASYVSICIEKSDIMKYLATSRSHKSNTNIHNIHAQIIQNENHHLIKICVELKNQLDPT